MKKIDFADYTCNEGLAYRAYPCGSGMGVG